MSDTAATAATASSVSDSIAPAPPPVVEPEPEPVVTFVVGNIVKHEWTDDYDGESIRYGIVVDVVDADPSDENSVPRVTVSWLAGAATMAAADLTGV